MKEKFKNMKIGTKLIVFFLVVLVLYAATVVVSILNVKSMSSRMDFLYDGAFANVRTSQELVANMQLVGKNITLLTTGNAYVDSAAYIEETKRTIEKVDRGLTELTSGYVSAADAVTELKEVFSQLFEPRDKIMEYIEADDVDKALDLYVKSYLPKSNLVKQKLESVIELCVADAENNLAAGQRDNVKVVSFMIILAVLVVAITLTLWILVTRSILVPIKEVKGAANAIAQGDLDIQLDYRATNELGQLAEDIRNTAAALKSYVTEIRSGMSALGKGKLNYVFQADFQGDFIAMGQSLNEISRLLRESIAQISNSAEQVSAGAEQVSNGSQMLAQGASEQAGSIEELAVSINEIADSVRENADTAINASGLANDMGTSLTECNKEMSVLLESISEIEKNSVEITGIVKEIEDIAFQTNILALNASVEAARAGDAGRGFAVVAGEIRRLAAQTTSASKLTAGLAGKNSEAVNSGIAAVDVTARSLKESVGRAQDVNRMVSSISKLSVAQADAIAQIRKNVELISDIVQGNSATSEESAAASEELSAQAQIMKELVEQFEI